MVIVSLGAMKRLAVRRFTVIAFVSVAQCNILVAALSENSAARDLAAAKTFAFGGIGVAGLTSDGERNLRAILDRADASELLQASLVHATPAGELYIVVGLRRCDPVVY